jgi:hypothetical protein
LAGGFSIFGRHNSLNVRKQIPPERCHSLLCAAGFRISPTHCDCFAKRPASRFSPSCASVLASNPTESSLDFEGSSYLAAAEPVSADYREIIGVRPFFGRWFANADEPEAVISYRAWQRVFHRGS